MTWSALSSLELVSFLWDQWKCLAELTLEQDVSTYHGKMGVCICAVFGVQNAVGVPDSHEAFFGKSLWQSDAKFTVVEVAVPVGASAECSWCCRCCVAGFMADCVPVTSTCSA